MKSYVKGEENLDLIKKTIPQAQKEVTKRFKNKEFLVSIPQKVRLTFEQFDNLTNKVGKGLMGLGVSEEDRVGIAMPNSIEWIAAFFALFKIGAYPVNIVPTLKPSNLEYMLNQPGLKLLIADKRNVEIVYKKIQKKITMVLVDKEEPDIGSFKNFFFWEELFAEAENIADDEIQARIKNLKSKELAALCYTSGTTGRPKGVKLTHYGLLNNCSFLAHLFEYNHSDIMPLTVPMFHFFGWVLSILTIQQGMKLVIPTSYVRPESILECLEKEKCTTMGSAPQIFNFFINLPNLNKYDLSELRHCFVGSDVVGMELIESMFKRLKLRRIQNIWGSTELGGGFTITPPTDATQATKEKITPIGKIMPHSEVKIVDPDTGKSLPRGEEGEIWCRGPSTFDGYWQKEEATRQTITPKKWVRTGDIGFMDKEGFIHFVGRLDEIFKKGAKKIAPAPIEAVLKQHPEIIDAGVVGVPDEKYGLEVAAFVQIKEETLRQIEKHRNQAEKLRKKLQKQARKQREEIQKQIAEQREQANNLRKELLKLARKHLEAYKVPKYVKFVKELPRTATGKIRHFILKEEAKKLVNS